MLPQDTIFVQGDTLELQFQLFKNKATNEYWNLTNHEIRFQLNCEPLIYKATANVHGGGDDQITLIDAIHGIFLITIKNTESKDVATGDYEFVIQITTPDDKKYTVLQDTMRIVDEAIEWGDEP